MDLKQYSTIYFIGIGGIGMSALARYFNVLGYNVLGYDKTPSELTGKLEEEGISIHYTEEESVFQASGLNPANTLVVYTPAIPATMRELIFVQEQGFTLLKRSQVLGAITQITKGLGVAGTHGKTTTSTLLAHILNQSVLGCTAFLGGISANFESNLLINKDSEYTVIEADEFDRSFLQLNPFASIVTSCDPDHLDIYETEELFRAGFEAYTEKINPNGYCIQKFGINLPSSATIITYGIDCVEADFYGTNLKVVDGHFYMDVHNGSATYLDIVLGLPGKHNAENALACFVLCLQLGLDEQSIRNGLKSFKGVKRRFEYQVQTADIVYIDDYAHHPTELKALIDSLYLLYPNRNIVGVFQPHLFSRTRDFLPGFIEQLSRFSETILMPIYPARELPIEGVSSSVIVNQLSNKAHLMTGTEVLAYFEVNNADVVVTAGAGDIDRIVKPLSKILREKLG